MDRDEKLDVEALALWLEMYREPPIVRADGTELIDAMIKSLPHVPYGDADDGGGQTH